MMPIRKLLTSNQGFTYLGALMIVVIMGIMLGAVGQTWQTIMKREREEELLFRGKQYQDALTRWHNPRNLPGQQQVRGQLNDIKDLLKDPRSVNTVRYIRRLYKDPITGDDFAPIMGDPSRGIVGVRSTSEDEAMKQANFPAGLENLEGKKKYSEWEFRYIQPGQQVTPGRQTGQTGQTQSWQSGSSNQTRMPGGT